MSDDTGTAVVVGLGNPGPQYEKTRHNIGFMVADVLAGRVGGKFSAHKRSGAEIVQTRLVGRQVILAKPRSYMNLSGDVIAPLVAKESLPLNRLLIVCDDFAIPLGTIRLRKSGTDGGHNGLASAIDRLGSIDFARLRLGVGPVPPRVDPAEFVLASFSPKRKRRWTTC